MDLALIGASWEKERARELGGQSIPCNIVIFLLTSMNTPVPKAVYTTFYLGALQENNDSVCIPNPYFAMIFKSTLLLANSSLRDVFHLLVLTLAWDSRGTQFHDQEFRPCGLSRYRLQQQRGNVFYSAVILVSTITEHLGPRVYVQSL